MKGNARFVFWSSSPGDLLAGKRLSCFQLFIESSLFSSRICIFAFEVYDVNFFVARVPSKNFFPGPRQAIAKAKAKKKEDAAEKEAAKEAAAQKEDEHPDTRNTLPYNSLEIFEQFGAASVKAEEGLEDSGEETEAARIARQNTLQLGSPVKPIEIEDSQMLQDRQPEEPYAPTPTPPKGSIKDEEKGDDEEEPLPDHEGSEKGEQEDLEEEEHESDPVLPDDVREDHKLEVIDTLQHLQEDFGVETIDEAITILQNFKNGIPVTSRIDQFAKRPARQPKGKGKGKKGKAKAKAKSKAKAKAKSKSKGGRKGKGKGEAPVEEISDEEQQEDEQNEEDQEEDPEEEEEAPRRVPRRPAAKAKGKAKAKAKAKGKANSKFQKSKSKEGDEEETEPETMKRPAAASKEDPKEDTKKKKRAEEPEPAEPAEPAEPEKKKKKKAADPPEPEKKVRAKPGEASSFARRPCPCTSPAKTRWLAIRNTYKNDVEKKVEDAGGNARAWEDCFWSWMLCLNSTLGSSQIDRVKFKVLHFPN